jgi:hypothetical protein
MIIIHAGKILLLLRSNCRRTGFPRHSTRVRIGCRLRLDANSAPTSARRLAHGAARLSDLHTEFADFVPPDTGADAVVLAGDIGVGTAGLEWATASTSSVLCGPQRPPTSTCWTTTHWNSASGFLAPRCGPTSDCTYRLLSRAGGRSLSRKLVDGNCQGFSVVRPWRRTLSGGSFRRPGYKPLQMLVGISAQQQRSLQTSRPVLSH